MKRPGREIETSHLSEEDTESSLVIVHWNPTNPYKAQTTLHHVIGRTNPSQLDIRAGMSIGEYFESRGISVEEFMQEFPDHIIFLEGEKNPSWRSPMIEQTIPEGQIGLQRLADFIGMPVETFDCNKFGYEIPKLQYKVVPSLEAKPSPKHLQAKNSG